MIHLPLKERGRLFRAASFQLGVNQTVIEKDFWVCSILQFLFYESQFRNCFVFKGGTSLSKCYDVIHRFSEDLDLILKWDVLGISDDEVYRERSKTQDAKFEISLNQKGSVFVREKLKPELERLFCPKAPGAEVLMDEHDPMVLYLAYPVASPSAYVRPRVKLEIGPMAATTPYENREISPYCGPFIPMGTPRFAIPTITIARTFWEKVLILYAETNRPASKMMPLRYSRHYYDVYMIYRSRYFAEILQNRKLFVEVRAFKSRFYRTAWACLEDCELSEIALIPNQNRLPSLKADYRQMEEMLFGSHPSFEEILEGLKELESVLRSASKEN